MVVAGPAIYPAAVLGGFSRYVQAPKGVRPANAMFLSTSAKRCRFLAHLHNFLPLTVPLL